MKYWNDFSMLLKVFSFIQCFSMLFHLTNEWKKILKVWVSCSDKNKLGYSIFSKHLRKKKKKKPHFSLIKLQMTLTNNHDLEKVKEEIRNATC